jgi:hypothetical protein
MKTSEIINELAEALAKAQGQMKHALKDSNNPAFGSKYADLVAVWDVARAPLSENGLCVIQMPIHSEDGRLHLTTRIAHKSGQWIEETMSIPVAKDNAHGYGSGITYCKRFALSAAVGIVADLDDDGNEASKATNGNAAAAAKPLKPAFATAHTARDTAVDEYNRMTPEEQQWAREQALELIALHDDGKDMYRWKETQNWSAEEFMAIWSQLPSNVRTKFKKQKVDALSKPLAAELASQP